MGGANKAVADTRVMMAEAKRELDHIEQHLAALRKGAPAKPPARTRAKKARARAKQSDVSPRPRAKKTKKKATKRKRKRK